MGLNGLDYKPEVAWRTRIREAVLITEETLTDPAIYQITVSPTDTNEVSNPGASTAAKAVGYYVMDYVGHIYRITEINVGGNPTRIKVADDFRWGESPTNGQQGILYKSAGNGYAPWLSATYGSHLARTAVNMGIGIDHAILWKMSERILCENTDTPSLVDYQTNYSIPYGDKPKVKLFREDYDNPNNLIEYSARPRENYVAGVIDSIDFGQLDEVRDWIIEISR